MNNRNKLDYVPSWLDGTTTLLQKLNRCIEKIEEIGRTDIEIDNVPTEGSENLVKSGGVYSSIHDITANDITANNGQTVQQNLERIDLEVEGAIDDIADLNTGKLSASKSAVASVGGLVTPTSVLVNNELVGVGIEGEQIRVQLGEGLTLEGDTSPYILKANGGGGGDFYSHAIFLARSTGYGSCAMIEFVTNSPTFNFNTEVNKLVGAKITYSEYSHTIYTGIIDTITISEFDEPNDQITGILKSGCAITTQIASQGFDVDIENPVSYSLLLKENGAVIYNHYSRKM